MGDVIPPPSLPMFDLYGKSLMKCTGPHKNDVDSQVSEAYIYFNLADRHWWLDGPDGMGVFKAKGPSWAPPAAAHRGAWTRAVLHS